MKVALVGMMASGKTTIGRELARLWGVPFVDSDHEMIARSGMPVAEYFARHGEAAFRTMERETVGRLLAGEGSLVMSLGGGAYMQEAVRRVLAERARTVFLQVGAEEIVRRLEGTDIAKRPLLAAAADWRARVGELLAEREAVYAGAEIRFDANGRVPGELARELAARLAPEAAQKKCEKNTGNHRQNG